MVIGGKIASTPAQGKGSISFVAWPDILWTDDNGGSSSTHFFALGTKPNNNVGFGSPFVIGLTDCGSGMFKSHNFHKNIRFFACGLCTIVRYHSARCTKKCTTVTQKFSWVILPIILASTHLVKALIAVIGKKPKKRFSRSMFYRTHRSLHGCCEAN